VDLVFDNSIHFETHSLIPTITITATVSLVVVELSGRKVATGNDCF